MLLAGSNELESSPLPPILFQKYLVKVVIIIRCSIVRNTAVIVMLKVCRTPGPFIYSRVSFSTSAELSVICNILYPPIQFPRDKRTCSPLCSLIESVIGPVIVFASTQDIIAAAVDIVIVLVTAIVVTQGDVVAGGVVIAK